MKIAVPPMPEPDRAKAAINCQHWIKADRLSLYFDPTKPGHNALNQLGNRLEEVERAQLAARDQQWLELVGPLVEATEALMAGSVYKTIGGDADWHIIAMPKRSALEKARLALSAITEEQE